MKRAWYYALSAGFLLIAWLATSFFLNQFAGGAKSSILPHPLAALNALGRNWSEITSHFLISLFRLTVGLVLSTVVGAGLGLLIGYEERLDRFLSPLVYITYPVPKVVFLPLIFVLLGFTNTARIVFIFLVVVFQVLISARDAAKNLSPSWILTVKSAGGTKSQIYKHVVIPAALPAILTSLRISIGIGIAALYLAESSYTHQGLGYYIDSTWRIFSYPDVFAGILSMGILGLVLYIFVDVIERFVCKWKYQ